jgi:GAF domain-containing protein
MTDPLDESKSSDDPVSGLSFAHAARLQFDEILEQLVASARQVRATQGRLRGLLRAYLAVARADNLDDVLRHIVEAARILVDAHYAALGVVAGNGLIRFIHSGMDADTVREIGHLPEGKGVLGLLVDRPEPLRLLNIAEHIASVGFPDHHPPMTTFLGVPIRIADRVFGNIYATDKNGGNTFTSDDEELLLALAAAAGVAIENATLLAQGRRRQAWQSAMVEVATDLLGEADVEAALGRLVRSTREALEGTGALAAVPTDDQSCFRIVAAEGAFAGQAGAEIPRATDQRSSVMARWRR